MSIMKRLVLWAILALLLLPAGARAQRLPACDLKDNQGKTLSSASLADHQTPFAITFWASWCHPCLMELSALTDMAPDWEKPLRIYAICEDDARSLSRAKALAADSDWPVTVLYDDKQELAKALSVSSIPHVFVFDKDGKRIFTHIGYAPGDEEILVQKLLEAQ